MALKDREADERLGLSSCRYSYQVDDARDRGPLHALVKVLPDVSVEKTVIHVVEHLGYTAEGGGECSQITFDTLSTETCEWGGIN
jgi:hypothetical protein